LVKGILPGKVVRPGDESGDLPIGKLLQCSGQREVFVQGRRVVNDAYVDTGKQRAESLDQAVPQEGEFFRYPADGKRPARLEHLRMPGIYFRDAMERNLWMKRLPAPREDEYPQAFLRQETRMVVDGALHSAHDGRRGVVEHGDPQSFYGEGFQFLCDTPGNFANPVPCLSRKRFRRERRIPPLGLVRLSVFPFKRLDLL
jgi:hypothetical protein